MCTMTLCHTENTPLQNKEREGMSLAWKAQRERLIHFDRGPDGYPSSSFFRFDDGAKLKKRDLGDVSYLEKKCLIFAKGSKSDKYKKKKKLSYRLFFS